MTYVPTSRRSEQGFTLVELAIVMVIIGLLIGGILKGQELINNAQITATVSQLKGFDAALNTFQDKYNVMPGEVVNPATRLPDCVAPCNNAPTTVNGRFDNLVGGAVALTSEGVVALSQLAAADLISGVNPRANNLSFGNSLPTVKAGGGMWFASTNNAGTMPTGFVGTAQSNRNFAVLNGNPTVPNTGTGAISVISAAQVDRKLDDGLPNGGSTRAGCNNNGVANDVYVESEADSVCSMVVRVMN